MIWNPFIIASVKGLGTKQAAFTTYHLACIGYMAADLQKCQNYVIKWKN
jgi:hypothetical protein